MLTLFVMLVLHAFDDLLGFDVPAHGVQQAEGDHVRVDGLLEGVVHPVIDREGGGDDVQAALRQDGRNSEAGARQQRGNEDQKAQERGRFVNTENVSYRMIRQQPFS